jgi:hypothetical protein
MPRKLVCSKRASQSLPSGGLGPLRGLDIMALLLWLIKLLLEVDGRMRASKASGEARLMVDSSGVCPPASDGPDSGKASAKKVPG